MYVRPAYNGRKIGLNLEKATVNEALRKPHINQIFLGVKEINPRAIRVYEQAGFLTYEPEPTRNDYRIMVRHHDELIEI